MYSLTRIAQPINLCKKYWKQNKNIWSSFCAMMIWVTSDRPFFFFVSVFCTSNSAANVEIEPLILIANKNGYISYYNISNKLSQEENSYWKPKIIKFRIKSQPDWNADRLSKRKYLLTQQFFMTISTYSDPVFSKSSSRNKSIFAINISYMCLLWMHLNLSLQHLLLCSSKEIWKFYTIFSKSHFYTNDKSVQSTKETVTNRISSLFYSILLTNRWVIWRGGFGNVFM